MLNKNNFKKIATHCATGILLSFSASQMANASDDFILAHAYPADHIFNLASTTFIDQLKESKSELGVKYLTFYAFSTENWDRPQYEVSGLMELYFLLRLTTRSMYSPAKTSFWL